MTRKRASFSCFPLPFLVKAAAAALLFAAILAALPGPPASADTVDRGTLVMGVENDFAGFELLTSGRRLAINGAIAANTMMEPLFRMDKNDQLIPVLGLSATSSDDGRQWTVTLRQNVLFHDRTPFNADAVVHHWNRMLGPESKFSDRYTIAPIASVDRIDEYTVRFTLNHAWIPFLKFLSSSRSLISLIPSPATVEAGTQDRAPVGTGPFRFSEWQAGDRFTVIRNPGYWDSGKPKIETIVFRNIPDHQTRYASLQSGDADVIWMDRGIFLEKAESDPSLTVLGGVDNGAEIFILNTTSPPLDNVAIRQAVAHAHNQAQQVAMVYQDSIPIVSHPFGDRVACADTGYRQFDPGTAKSLLADAGLPLALECLHSSSQRGRETGEIFQQNLKAIGLDVTPVGLNFGPVIKKVMTGDYQISTWRISARPDQGPSLFSMFHSKSRANFSRYSNPEMDQLLEAQRVETDPAKRDALLCRIAGLINRDAPILYRGGMANNAIAHNKVKGLPEMVDGILLLSEAWKEQP